MSTADNTFSKENAEDSSGFLLWQVTNLWQREIRKALQPHDLTHAQFVLLASAHWLLLHGTEVTQIVLAQHTKIDPMTTSTVLRTLQNKGLIERASHQTDTRAKTIVLTPKGKQLIKKAVVTVEQFDASFFGVLGKQVNALNQQLLLLLQQRA